MRKNKICEKQREYKLAKENLLLYRFFEEKWQAESLLNGKIWISTLEKCRQFECPQQGDKDEGTSTYHQVSLVIHNRIITVMDHIILDHLGIGGFPPPGTFYHGRFEATNNRRTNKIPNGLILCTTNNQKSIQEQSINWNYGVKFTCSPKKIYQLISNALNKQGIPIENGKHGWADYNTERKYFSPLEQPTDLAFLKPKHQALQSEYRFFWECKYPFTYPEHGILIDCPEIKRYVKEIEPSP